MAISRDLLTTHITDTTDVLACNSQITRLGDRRYSAAIDFDHAEYSARRGISGAVTIPTSLDVHVTKPNFEKEGNIHHSKRDNFTIPAGAIVFKAWSYVNENFAPGATVIHPWLGADDLGNITPVTSGTSTDHTANIGTELMAADTEVFMQITIATAWTAGAFSLFIEYYYTDTVSTVS